MSACIYCGSNEHHYAECDCGKEKTMTITPQQAAYERVKAALQTTYEDNVNPLRDLETLAPRDEFVIPEIPEDGPGYIAGLYSRRNIKAFIEDLKAAPQPTKVE